jgi:hypothetical protein
VKLVFGNYLLGYEFLAMIMSLEKVSIGHIVNVAYSFLTSTTASPSRSSLRKLVKGGNSSIFLSICFAVRCIRIHRFNSDLEQVEQSPSWKREASAVKDPVRLAAGILNTYVRDSFFGSIVAVRAALRSENLSILCRRPMNEVMEQRQGEHI